MIKRIAVGLAGTTYTPVAIHRAVSLAQAQDAEVTGVTVFDRRRLGGVWGAAPPPREDGAPAKAGPRTVTETNIAESIDEFRAACEAVGIRHQVVEESGDAFTRLLEVARFHDVMVFGLRSVLDYDFRAGDPQSLLVRLVGAGARPLIAVSETYRSISRVMIALSESMESANAMKRFVQMRLWPDAELKIVTFHPSSSKANELLQGADDYCRSHGYTVCHQSNPGEAGALLIAAATVWQADLIVMGSSARSVLRRKLLGDTLLETLRHTRIPLFLAQ